MQQLHWHQWSDPEAHWPHIIMASTAAQRPVVRSLPLMTCSRGGGSCNWDHLVQHEVRRHQKCVRDLCIAWWVVGRKRVDACKVSIFANRGLMRQSQACLYDRERLQDLTLWDLDLAAHQIGLWPCCEFKSLTGFDPCCLPISSHVSSWIHTHFIPVHVLRLHFGSRRPVVQHINILVNFIIFGGVDKLHTK